MGSARYRRGEERSNKVESEMKHVSTRTWRNGPLLRDPAVGEAPSRRSPTGAAQQGVLPAGRAAAGALNEGQQMTRDSEFENRAKRLDAHRERLLPLLAGMDHHLSVRAFVEGTMPGTAYVDDVERPTVAFVHNNEGWYVIGENGNGGFNAWLNRFLTDDVLPFARDHGETEIPLHYHPDGWELEAGGLLAGFDVRHDAQYYLRFAGPLTDRRSALPADCTVVPVTADLLSQTERYPVPRLAAWAKGGFGAVEAFAAAGLGKCLEWNGEIVCWCMPDCAVPGRCEIGIHTAPDHRRRGYAAITVAAVVEDCLEKGYREIGWHCWSANTASRQLAEKVGFAHVLRHPAFWLKT